MKLGDTQFHPSLLRYGRFTGYFEGIDEKPVRWTKRICYDYEIEYYTKSDGGVWIDGKFVPFSKGDISVRKPGQCVAGVPPYNCYVLCFDACGSRYLPDGYLFGDAAHAQPLYDHPVLNALPSKLSCPHEDRLIQLFEEIEWLLALQEGLYRGGLVPFGYRLEHLGRTNKKNQPVRDLVIDEQESEIVKEIYHKTVSEGWGSNRIANWLNDRHISTKRHIAFWRATSIRALVRNPIYTGRIRFGDDLSDPFEHLRIIDDALFEQCEQMIRQRSPCKSSERIGNLRSTSDGLLTGLLFCGSCGERLCFNHNTTVRTLADGTRRVYERDVYRCYRKVNSRSTCQGQSTYAAQRIEKDVLAVVHGYFENIRTRPTAQMLSVAGERTRRIQEEALKQAEAALKKAQTEMTALEEAAVKALTGEGSMDLQFINSLIPKRKANLENALGEVERLRRELAEIEKAEQAASRELEMILSWAETFDAASRETQRSIIAMLIDRIVVYSDYRLDIHFRITVQQYLGKAS